MLLYSNSRSTYCIFEAFIRKAFPFQCHLAGIWCNNVYLWAKGTRGRSCVSLFSCEYSKGGTKWKRAHRRQSINLWVLKVTFSWNLQHFAIVRGSTWIYIVTHGDSDKFISRQLFEHNFLFYLYCRCSIFLRWDHRRHKMNMKIFWLPLISVTVLCKSCKIK